MANTTSIHHVCPECGSAKLWRDGLRYTRSNGSPSQRWLCRNCGYRFSEGNNRGRDPYSEASEDVYRRPNASEGVQNVDRQVLNCRSALPSSRQVCELLTEGSKNLATVDTTRQSQQSQAAGATEKIQQDVKGKILEHAFWLKKQGFREYTIKMRMVWLTLLVKRGANLYNPENVKEVIALQETWNENTKVNVVSAYDTFLRMLEMKWDPPRYKVLQRLPFIPLEGELDQLISAANKKLAAFLQTLKETGMRSGEAWRLRWINIDFKSNAVTLNDPEKYSNPRMFKVSGNLLTMLNLLPKKNDHVFGNGNLKGFGCTYMKLRKRLAHKLQNPRLQEISFHTFRHWKATMEYHKTKDILHVRQLLGHKNINNTLKYTQLVNFESDEWHSATAQTTTEAQKLIEAGFEYVCTTPESLMLFRKRK